MKSPAFQFYPSDWLGSQRVQLMSLEEEGAYTRLICYCWLHGSIPSDAESLAKLIGKGGSTTLVTKLATMFQPSQEAGRLVHDRLERERSKQAAWREKSSAGGRKSAAARAKKPKRPRVVEPPLQGSLPNGSNQNPTLLSSSPSSVSVSDSGSQSAAKPPGGTRTVIPLLLSTDEFAAAWTDWLAHRKEIRHPVAPGSQTERGQLKMLESWGVERAIAAIRHTIFKGWQGLKEPDERDQRAAAGSIGKRSSMAG